ncbi:hypothetical protein F511_07690 [Dorcoceras hygrometricum]|uniref:Late embryogenesis abundant protein LEA-2 subgroup domain-containing protein n=1 Tax=Dorcoceras hygrometricum TaxID=472368 RepID=A0A2Z7CMU5_9LAMI|nr:hypothetical protein F511_07690 [Dorcoceras hygrometricum]
MANYRTDSLEDEALFRSYHYALYFVQSPSNVSHSNTNNNNNDEPFTYVVDRQSPLQPDHHNLLININPSYSSSRGSNHSFLHEKNKISSDQTNKFLGPLVLKNGFHDNDDDDDEFSGDRTEQGWQRYLSLSYSDSWWWIFMQLAWRFLVSLMIALIVFCLAAKPPTPQVFVKMGGIHQFKLGEGVDATGVTTKILTCNASMELTIENKSKLFGLHIHSPITSMLFGHLPFATSQGGDLYAGSDGLTSFELYFGTTNKAMYGGGRNMQDLLESGNALPITIKLSFASKFLVVWGLFEPKFHREALCLMLINNSYDKKHRTQKFNSTCTVTP